MVIQPAVVHPMLASPQIVSGSPGLPIGHKVLPVGPQGV